MLAALEQLFQNRGAGRRIARRTPGGLSRVPLFHHWAAQMDIPIRRLRREVVGSRFEEHSFANVTSRLGKIAQQDCRVLLLPTGGNALCVANLLGRILSRAGLQSAGN